MVDLLRVSIVAAILVFLAAVIVSLGWIDPGPEIAAFVIMTVVSFAVTDWYQTRKAEA
ncbi:hypothetical protein [Halalkalirubrum salinum]|uniref:hypothetical protein n=1 Tax=Halalkalirubrum salinum TaxID=2563889 RepID=UPI00148553D9|nr:hypothetical protein [Halalkalirubrum salinum]